jgi:hypothetical protein
LWIICDKPQPNVQQTLGGKNDSLPYERKQLLVHSVVSFETNANSIVCLTVDGAKAMGIDMPLKHTPSIAKEYCVQSARKYGLSLDEANALITWHNTFGAGADDNVEANKVAVICIKHKFSRNAIRELLGPYGIECPDQIYFTYYPGHNLSLHFGVSNELHAVEIAGNITMIE